MAETRPDLGLWISSSLVERYGGDIQAANRADGRRGAVFTVRLLAEVPQAVVVFSGLVNLAIPVTTDGLYLKVVTGANNLSGSTVGTTVPGWDIHLHSTNGLGFFNPASPAGGSYVVSSGTAVAKQTPGARIGAGSGFGSGGTTLVSQWNLNSPNSCFGFRFTNEATGQVYRG